ncbi:MAG: hypothetical protein K0Q90_2646 [Paenibacillaceae bacterium]|nr:hypothetical protein [Paenibacillaceae bacterium]
MQGEVRAANVRRGIDREGCRQLQTAQLREIAACRMDKLGRRIKQISEWKAYGRGSGTNSGGQGKVGGRSAGNRARCNARYRIRGTGVVTELKDPYRRQNGIFPG